MLAYDTVDDAVQTPNTSALSRKPVLDNEMTRWLLALAGVIVGGLVVCGLLIFSGAGSSTTGSSAGAAQPAFCGPTAGCLPGGMPGAPVAGSRFVPVPVGATSSTGGTAAGATAGRGMPGMPGVSGGAPVPAAPGALQGGVPTR